MRIFISLILLMASLALTAGDALFLKGITVSCQGSGRIWGTDAFAQELDRLLKLGANSVTIHPYARIQADGAVSWRGWLDSEPPEYIVRPIREAHRRGMKIMIKPHLAYWGSPFSWRGDIRFDDPKATKRFYETYTKWIVAVARITADADIFVVGAELRHMTGDQKQWRHIIQSVRQVSSAQLTYAANWDHFEKVPFWDALDLIGVQGYFPITREPSPDVATLRKGWQPVLSKLKRMHNQLNRPIVFTEFGYNRSLKTAAEPWRYKQDTEIEAEHLQARCLEVGLKILGEEHAWFRGAFLWKWFAGSAPYANFYLDTPMLRRVITEAWR